MSNDTSIEVTVQAQDDQSRGPAVVEKFVIRLPLGLRDQIRQLSESNRRSMNSEIIMVLENHIRAQMLQQMADASGDDRLQQEIRKSESELDRMLQSLPSDKKAALLQLLG